MAVVDVQGEEETAGMIVTFHTVRARRPVAAAATVENRDARRLGHGVVPRDRTKARGKIEGERWHRGRCKTNGERQPARVGGCPSGG